MPSDVVADRVVELRRSAGLTRDQLAARVEALGSPLSPAALANIETGRRDKDGRRRREVSVEELLVLAAALDVTPAALVVDLDADEAEVAEQLRMFPVELLWWVTGGFPPGRDRTDRTPFPHPAYQIALDLHRDWVTVQQAEERPISPHAEDDERETERARRPLRRKVERLRAAGAQVPEEIERYLAAHPPTGDQR